MSRIGNQLIQLSPGVTATVANDILTITGPKGSLTRSIPQKVTIEITDGQIFVKRLTDDKKVKSNHGTMRAHAQNMVTGVVTPWTKNLEIRGTGFKAVVSGNKLIVTAGFIHTVDITAPVGVQFVVTEDTKILVTGCDKELVGQTASNIRKIRKPEPYKGKGIRYMGEQIKLKAGKKAKA